MLGMKTILLLATSLLLILCSVHGSLDVGTHRQLAKGEESGEVMTARKKGSKGSKGEMAEKETSEDLSDDDDDEEDDDEEEDDDDDDDEEEEGSGKGKGKGGSSSSKGSGKGKGGSKSGEGGSKGSSKKVSKKSKGSKKGGQPTPTRMPSMPSPTTPSPTSADSIPIRAVPFALSYTILDERIPSTSEYAQLADLTRVYLEEYMIDEFSQTSLTNLDDFLTFMIRNSFEFGRPVQADYRSTGLFNPSSIFLPTVRELNQLIDTAFMGENLDEYLHRVRSLPSDNIFSTTTTITIGSPSLSGETRSSESAGAGEGSGYVKAGVASAAAGIVVLAAGLVLLKKRREDELSDEFDKEYGRNLKGDATIAGETCNMSLDGSMAWRKESPYADNDDLDEEFEDEPLDSDDEGADAPRHPPSKAFKHAIATSSS